MKHVWKVDVHGLISNKMLVELVIQVVKNGTICAGRALTARGPRSRPAPAPAGRRAHVSKYINTSGLSAR